MIRPRRVDGAWEAPGILVVENFDPSDKDRSLPILGTASFRLTGGRVYEWRFDGRNLRNEFPGRSVYLDYADIITADGNGE